MTNDVRMRSALAPWGGGPLVLAHRGASGYLPEHTLEAYALAVAQGADLVEPDVVASRDGALVCLHDVHLERVTNVAEVFPGRARDDGRWHALDLTLAELRRLDVTAGARHGIAGCRIPTLDEAIGLVQHLGRGLGREVGLVPELKAPALHREAGVPLEAAFARAVAGRGYEGPEARCWVQSFEASALQLLRDELDCALPNLLLTGGEGLDDARLDGISKFADSIGPHRDAAALDDGALVSAAHARGLAVVPYTFGDEPDAMRAFFHELGVDALFSDFPDVAVAARDA